jgi:hypothetical protein
MMTTQTTAMNRSRIRPATTALWASAFVIAALAIVQAGRLPGSSAYAETTAESGDYTLLTARSGKGPEDRPNETLWVIDNREQVLMVYELEDAIRGTLTVRGGGSLHNLFLQARPR